MDINTYENDEKELEAEVEEEAFEEFEEDFDAQKADYQVWVLGYDENDNITDFEEMVYSDPNPDNAVDYAKAFIKIGMLDSLKLPDDIAYVEVLVETVVEVDGYEVNVGNLFDDHVLIKKEI